MSLRQHLRRSAPSSSPPRRGRARTPSSKPAASQQPRSAARPYIFGDGGNFENQGIMPLLRRRLPKIVAFVNTEIQIAQQGPTGQEGFDKWRVAPDREVFVRLEF